MIIFEAKNLTVANKADKLICENFTLQIRSDEIWMISGLNGVGKSSFYESLVGLRKIIGGELWLRDINITQTPTAQRIRLGLKYIAQQNALFDWATVYDNLLILAQALLPHHARKDAIEKAIELFELKQFVKKTPAQLSGGQKRRVELSKIAIGPAHLVIIDEPFAAIDDNRTEKLCKLFRTMADEGLSFLLNDHNQHSLQKIANFCIMLNSMEVIDMKATCHETQSKL